MRAREFQPAAPVEPLLEQEHDMSVTPSTTADHESQALADYSRRHRLVRTRKLQETYRLLRQLGRAFPPTLTVGEVEDQLHAEADRLLRLLAIRIGTKAHRDICG